MTPERWKRVRECFEAASDAPADQRAVVVARVCGGDAELRREVGRLLEHDAPVTAFEGGIAHGPPGESHAGDRVGPYRLVREVGCGGMSIVWLAERADEEFRARVAVKFIRTGVDVAGTATRFRQERQVLANLRHPNISRLLDAGALPDGRPYLIMEYVDGVHVDRYCERRGLSIRARLELFIEVCAAVHFAHQNLVVHRDLKPANILVNEEGTPILLDFGIAKLLAPDGSGDLTIGTSRLMTPRFASPEQIRGEALSTASDVYSLGVILYELLAGESPYLWEPDAAWSEVERVICKVEPPAPSLAVARGANRDADADADPPGPGPRPTSAALRGDLDTIVLKAMHKDPARRYSSAEQLASDLRRHLEGLPVLARADTMGYRATKFVRRHRVAVGAATLVFGLLTAMAIVTTVQSVRVGRRQQLADERAAQTLQVAAFQSSMLRGSTAEGLGRTIMDALRTQMTSGLSSRAAIGADGSVRRRTPEEVAAAVAAFESAVSPGDATEVGKAVMDQVILAPGVRALEGKFTDQPEVEARLRFTLGSVYNGYGLRDAAEPQLVRALELQRRTLGDRHPEVVPTLNELIGIARARRDFVREEELAREALDIRRASEQGDTEPLARAMDQYGLALIEKGELDAAEPVLRESLAMLRRLPGARGEYVARNLGNLGGLMLSRRNAVAAEPLMREAVEIERAVGATSQLALALNNLAGAQQALKDLPGAVASLREAAEIQKRVLGETHQHTLGTMGNLAGLLTVQKQYDEAEPLARFVLGGRLRTLAPDHFVVTVARVVLADILIATQRQSEAEPLLTAAWDAAKRDRGFSVDQRRRFVGRLIDVERALGRTELADRFAGEQQQLSPGG